MNSSRNTLPFRLSIASIITLLIATSSYTPITHAASSRRTFFICGALPTALIVTYLKCKTQAAEKPEKDVTMLTLEDVQAMTTEQLLAIILGQAGKEGGLYADKTTGLVSCHASKPRFGFTANAWKYVETLFGSLKTIKEFCDTANYFLA